MAISASSVAKNRIYKSISPKSLIDDAKAAIGSSTTFNQGDLLCVDTGTSKIRVVAATADAATFAGISDETVVSGKRKSPYQGTAVDASEAISAIKGPVSGVIAKMKLKSGDAFLPLGKVYLADGQDSMTVSSVDPGDGNYIGIFQDAGVTAVSGSEGGILLGSRFGAAVDF